MTENELLTEVRRRRTFAIISHPDAGKTTLTEKLLLFGGAIRLAGEVKGRKARKFATSDWMEIEKQRGISVTSSVMQFNYQGYRINILDTPGHQDFSEDTYRTLVAADSAVMILDAAKGVEAQTIKLFKVCRMRNIPIFTFINKMDRYGKEPLALLEELENVLGIRSCPMNWPIGMGDDFSGIYDRKFNRIERYSGAGEKPEREFIQLGEAGVEDESLKEKLAPGQWEKLYEDVMLLDIAGDPFDREKILKGELTPVYFGSAINKFGVQTFLESFVELALPPTPRHSDAGEISIESPFSGFIFKIQANMNPAHRDRIAFLRVCSGKFERGMNVDQVRTGKKLRLAQPQQFLAQDRNIVEEAWPGDIIGLHDPGVFQIGDTLGTDCGFNYDRLPQFSPEHFARVLNMDTGKYKQFQKGVEQLVEEGTVQVFKTVGRHTEEMILGVVGELQFEVFTFRLEAEYGARIRLERLPYQLARWLRSENPINLEKLASLSSVTTRDQQGNYVVLCESDYALNWLMDQNRDVTFTESSF